MSLTTAIPAFSQPLPAGDSLAAPRLPDTTVVFASVDTLDLKLDLYLPPRVARPGFLRSIFLDSAARDSVARFSGPRPLILWLHGGGWRGGSRSDPVPALPLLDFGYAVASADYRLSQQAPWPAQIHDAKAAVRWLRAHGDSFALDTSRFVAWGTSAGGHLAALLGLTAPEDSLEGAVGAGTGVSSGVSTGVRAVVDYYGASDFLEPHPQRWKRGSSVGQLLGCAVPQCSARARAASPVTYVSSGDTPFFLVHGTRDSVVPFSQSVLLDSALRVAGVPVIFERLDGAGHGGPAFTDPELLGRIRAFLDSTLAR